MSLRDPDQYPNPKPKYLRSKENGRIFIYTDLLWKSGNMEPLDALPGEEDAKELTGVGAPYTPAEEGQPGEEDEPSVDLESMTKPQLVEYAGAEYGVTLNINSAKGDLISAIKDLME